MSVNSLPPAVQLTQLVVTGTLLFTIAALFVQNPGGLESIKSVDSLAFSNGFFFKL